MKINKITPLGSEFTVDIEVQDTHSYQLSNGVVSHNSVSKLFNLTEGAHLPAMREYLRWVQFRSDDPLIEQYRARGYPVRVLKTYSGTTIVGFPTIPEICKLGMGDLLVTAPEATLEEQYQYLRLLEKWWIDGYEEGWVVDGHVITEAGGHGYGNQVSYTAKFDMKKVTFAEFRQTLLDGQSTIKCCSVMPEGDTSAYEYLPETPLSQEEFRKVVDGITDGSMKEDVGLEHLTCAGGACPISFDESKKAA